MGTGSGRGKKSLSLSGYDVVLSPTIKRGISTGIVYTSSVLMPQYAPLIFSVYKSYKLIKLGWRFIELYRNRSYTSLGGIKEESSALILARKASELGEKCSDKLIESHISDLRGDGIFGETSKRLIKLKKEVILQETSKIITEEEIERVSEDLEYIYRGTIKDMSKKFIEEFTKESSKVVMEAL